MRVLTRDDAKIYGEIYRIAPEDMAKSVSWGSVCACDSSNSDYVEVCVLNYLGYGEYDNSAALERANYRAFMDDYNDYSGVIDIRGYICAGHSVALVIGKEYPNEMIECLSALTDYPVICDGLVSIVESELEHAAFHEWIAADLNAALEQKFNLDYMDLSIDQYFSLKDLAGEYGEVECGGGFYIDIDKLAKVATLETVKA